jgi:hypothetical protein
MTEQSADPCRRFTSSERLSHSLPVVLTVATYHQPDVSFITKAISTQLGPVQRSDLELHLIYRTVMLSYRSLEVGRRCSHRNF